MSEKILVAALAYMSGLVCAGLVIPAVIADPFGLRATMLCGCAILSLAGIGLTIFAR